MFCVEPVFPVLGRQKFRPALLDHPKRFFTSKERTEDWSSSPPWQAKREEAPRLEL